MDEEYRLNENNDQTPEFQTYSEFNDESRIGEHEIYATEGGYISDESNRYNSGSSSVRSHQHQSLLRKGRNRIGRLLSLMAAVSVPVAVVVIVFINAVFVDVIKYAATQESLELVLSIRTPDEEAEFLAVLTDEDGNVSGEQHVSPASPTVLFTGLEAGGLYYFEVFDGETSCLKLSYILPTEENEPDETATAPPTNTPDNSGTATATPDNSGTASATPGSSQQATATPGQTGETETPTETPSETPTPDSQTATPDTSTATPYSPTPQGQTATPAPTATPTPTPDNSTATPYSPTPQGQTPTPTPTATPTPTPTATPTATPSGSTATPTPEPTAAPTAQPVPSASLASVSKSFNWIDMIFSVQNIDPSDILVTVNGLSVEAAQTTSSTLTVSLDGLDPDTTYNYKLSDGDGNTILSGSVTTDKRTAATVTPVSFSSSLTGANIVFSYENPDGNDITAKLDGTLCSYVSGNDSMTFVLSGLGEHSSHTLVFYDWDGTVILTYPFETRQRTAATASFGNITKTYNSVSMQISLNNPDANALELRVNGTSVNMDLSGANVQINLNTLSPRTTYTITVQDLSCGKAAGSTTFTTDTTAVFHMDGDGNGVFVLTNGFASDYPKAQIAITDSLGYTLVLTQTGTGTYYAYADDFVYGGSYTVSISNGDTEIDSFTATLTGKTRPSISVAHEGYGPATIEEALTSEMHESSVSYPGFRYTFNSGYIEPVDHDTGNTASGKNRRTALLLFNSDGDLVSAVLSGMDAGQDMGAYDLGQSQQINFETFGKENEFGPGQYTAALYTADGLTEDDVSNVYWSGYEYDSLNDSDLYTTFVEQGRRISQAVTLTVTEVESFGEAYMYPDPTPSALSDDEMVYYFTCYYYPAEEGEEGYLTIVSASNPTEQLIEPVSLGNTDVYGYNASRLFVHTTEPVCAIIYKNTFDPENYLYVLYYINE